MSSAVRLTRRLRNKWRRYAVTRWARRDFVLDSAVPYVSFTFDDYPRSAQATGGAILKAHGVRGTYFVSSALLGGPSVSGPIVDAAELLALADDGHEIGCHTRDHLDGTREGPDAFERSIAENRRELTRIVPDLELSDFAFPLDGPTVAVKRSVGRHFSACRGGGQTYNAGRIDLNLLKSFFLDWKSRDDMDHIDRLIQENAARRGWLIFSTHDVEVSPSPYGCTPACFEQVVRLACASGARVLPMRHVCAELGIATEAGIAARSGGGL